MSERRNIKPPRLADRLFLWYCNYASIEDLHGDVEELFYQDIQNGSVFQAKFNYWQRIVSLIFSYAIKKRKQKSAYHQYSTSTINFSMLKNYFLIATRSLAKHKFFTTINVLGLAIGMSVSLLFIAMITFVSTYDEFHINKDRIYRVIAKTNLGGRKVARTPLPLADKLRNEYSGIEEVIRFSNSLSGDVEFESRKIPMEGFFVDSHLLNTFSFSLLKGNATTCLVKPHSMVVTEDGAQRLFGNEDPMGKIVKMEKFGEFEITGVLKQLPKNSHIQFEIAVPFQALEIHEQSQGFVSSDKSWSDLNIYTYLLLPKTFQPDEPERINTFMNKIAHEVYPKNAEFKATFDLQSLPDIAPGPDLAWEIGAVWDIPSFVFFGVLTLLILLPACFNYTNISISRALKRSKEIGLRKVVGGQRKQIFFQFILEAVIVTLLALGVSYVFFTMGKNEFTSMIVDSRFLDLTPTITTILYFVGFAIFVGLIAGAVPALYFAKLNPIQALKSKSSSKASKGSILRKSLIIGQFALSLGFIMAVGITAKQQVATLNYNFGFDQENILDVELQGVDPDIFRNEFSKLSSVQSVSMSSGIMGASGGAPVWIQNPEKKDSTEVFQMFVDHNYLANLNLKLVDGNTFPDQQEDTEHYIVVNEQFLKKFEISNPAEALEKSFIIPGAGELKIIGVVKDFHYADLRMPIQSFIFRYDAKHFNYANLKVSAGDMHSAVANIDAVWKTIGGEKKLEARFFDDEIEDAYSTYQSMITICGFLGFLAITISCLGLLGMVVYATETRTKEIGVRKVMGASSSMIAILLSKDYLKLMLIATVIATPLTYFFFDILLFGEQYYRIPIGALEIILSILVMFILGLATILSQTLKAAKANPVETLRYE